MTNQTKKLLAIFSIISMVSVSSTSACGSDLKLESSDNHLLITIGNKDYIFRECDGYS